MEVPIRGRRQRRRRVRVLYLVGVVLIVFPLMLVEFAIGRRGRADAAYAIANVATDVGASRLWALCGLLGVAAAFIILSFYSVIGGWAIGYAVDTTLHGLAGADARAAQIRFDDFLAAPLKMAAYHFIYMAAATLIVARGISRGIEEACKILMPILIVLIIGLGLFSMTQGDHAAALRFLFRIDVAHLTLQTALDALGLGFFSIGVGLSLMITYAAYAGSDINLRNVAIITIIGDTAVSLAAGLAIFPIVFAEGLDPASGPGLMFVTLPLAFARIPGGDYAAIGFFLLLIVAALASGISMLEMPVAALTRRGWSRNRATSRIRNCVLALRPCDRAVIQLLGRLVSARCYPDIRQSVGVLSSRSSTPPTSCCRLVALLSRYSRAGSCRRDCSPRKSESACARLGSCNFCCAISNRAELLDVRRGARVPWL